jgi:hypothetical protein
MTRKFNCDELWSLPIESKTGQYSLRQFSQISVCLLKKVTRKHLIFINIFMQMPEVGGFVSETFGKVLATQVRRAGLRTRAKQGRPSASCEVLA